ncbi:hypothetical protein ACPB9E_35750 [Streptomyces exfoliatus]|uniref:hypothetical protein n=1 Tax=Streptomyces exfoliatus TaxID=1905 RepID=UPI003C30B8A5
MFPAGGPDQQAKVVQRRVRIDGVLMPMRLDVVVGGDRRILSFGARDEQVSGLPRATVTREQATAKALAAYTGARVTGSELLARRDGQGQWRVCWMVSLTPPDGRRDAKASGPGTASGPAAELFGMAFDAVTGAPFTDPARPRS